MTREAKIGMLTGLFVIVLIGVLLSEYLGGGAAANNRMSSLPQYGDAYRNRTLEPTGVPGAQRDVGAELPKAFAMDRTAAQVNSAAPGMPVLVADPGMGTAAAGSSASEPAVAAIQPMPAGPVLMDAGKPVVPTIETMDVSKGTPALYVAVGDQVPAVGQAAGHPAAPALVADKSGAVTAVAKDAPKGTEYTIVKGDTLQKIAAKFYKPATKEDVKKIVAANHTLLKDETSTLMIGKKLLIPDAPAATAVAKVETPVIKAPAGEVKKDGVSYKKDSTVVIRPPGSVETPVADAPKNVAAPDKKDVAKADKADAKPATTTVYVVKSGDTLEKIAKRVSSSGYADAMKKIVSLNGLKDKDSLQVGMKLKLPAKAV